VDQPFLNTTERVVQLSTGTGGADCGYRFAVGRRYLVYASRNVGGWLVAGTCLRTRPIEDAKEDLEYLKGLPVKGTGGRVYGRVNEWRREPFEERGVDYGPLAGMTVSVVAPTFQKDAVTDAHGRFEVTGVPTGKGSLTVLAPHGFDKRHLTRQFEIVEPRACRLEDFTLALSASASGTVIDSAGRPVAGVSVDAVAQELAGFHPPPYQPSVRTDERGVFEFDALPPGAYVFGINLTKSRYGVQSAGPGIYLPGVRHVAEASVIELKAGDEGNVGVLRLPNR
jgi:hypothetical protein